jgi:pimeloyl-ACP methyl ester carboxylesterase
MNDLNKVVAAVLLCLAAGRADAVRAAEPTATPDPQTAALRMPWSRGETRFARHWVVLGPIAIPRDVPQPLRHDPLADGEAALKAVDGVSVSLASGGSTKWQDGPSFDDELELHAFFASPSHFGTITSFVDRRRGSAPEVAYAATTVHRDTAGDVDLWVGSDDGLRIFVNGVQVHERLGRRVFAYDAERVPVRLEAGDNVVMLKLEHRTGPWRFALRVLETGAVPPHRLEIQPSLVSTDNGVLILRTDAGTDHDGAPVEVEMIAAGGTVLARAKAARGEEVRFPTAAWPDGAYEARCKTTTVSGRPALAHVPWYKGDPLPAARRLVEAASRAGTDAAGATIRMLAEMVVDRLGGSLDDAPEDSWISVHSPLMEWEELELEQAGRAARVRPSGFVRLSYIDESDGSPQFCRAYLPSDYDPARPSPLVIYLHGYHPVNPPYVRWWLSDSRHDVRADGYGVIYLEPHGRSNTFYLGMGERDVLRCLELAKQQLHVDDDRVYMVGESMGGDGAWYVATRHPDLFAAVVPVYGAVDYRFLGQDKGWIENLSVFERFLLERQGTYAGLENLLNVPLYVVQGEDTWLEPSRFAVRLLQRWGYDVRYHEYVGFGHEAFPGREALPEWLLLHRRQASPRHVRLRAGRLDAAAVHWVRVDERIDPFAFVSVDAEIVGTRTIRLDTSNVGRITLSPGPLLSSDGPVHVVWNGTVHEASLREGRVELGQGGKPTSAMTKRASLEGSFVDFIRTPFAVVQGTISRDPAMRARCLEKTEAFVRAWQTWQHVRPRVFRDVDLSRENEARYSLLLIGGADDNAITRRAARALPLAIAADAVTIDGRRFPVTDAAVQFLYPSPFNPDRYVTVVAGTSASGLHFWDPMLPGWWDPMPWDFIISDGRKPVVAPDTWPSHAFVAAGVLDDNWRRDDRGIVLGDSELRDKSPLRKIAAPGYRPPARLLDRYVGRYELRPGITLTVARQGTQLTAEDAWHPRSPLVAETDADFVLAESAELLSFRPDEAGVMQLVMWGDGQELKWKRVP